MEYMSTSELQESVRNPACPLSFREDLKSLLEVRSRPDHFHLILAMREALGDEWPDQEQLRADEEDVLFVATPRPGTESDLAELLLLESLAEEAAAGDSHSRLLVEHIEAECGATIGEVIAAQRSAAKSSG
jgi:hypothetical protein